MQGVYKFVRLWTKIKQAGAGVVWGKISRLMLSILPTAVSDMLPGQDHAPKDN